MGKNFWTFLHMMSINYDDNPTKNQQQKMKLLINLL